MSTDIHQIQPIAINNPDTFTPDPLYKLMAIFEDSDAGVSAAEDLKSSGFAEAGIELFCGMKGETAYDFTGEDHGPWASFLRSFRNITNDRLIMGRYQNALREGHCLLSVQIDKPVKKETAGAIMHKYNAQQVEYFGLLMTEKIADKNVAR